MALYSEQVMTHDADALIRVQGADAASFLNAQLTRRVDTLAEGETALAAWCNARGRVQALFRIARAADSYTLRVPVGMLPLALPRLRIFVLRSQVQIEAIQDVALPDTGAALKNVLAGIPRIYPETRDQFLPQMLNLDRLDAIDFKKGCYPGQEIVARTQYLGQLKRRMYRFSTDDTQQQPVAGTALVATNDVSGTVIDAARDAAGNWQILAVVPIESAQLPWRLTDSGKPLKRLPLPYALD